VTLAALLVAAAVGLQAGWAEGQAFTPDAGALGHAGVQDTLTLHFLDVGQGDAVLLRAPGGRNVLYDGGPSAEGVLAELRSLGVETLDLVIASHNHADHIGGLAAVIRAYRPRFVMDNGLAHTTLTYERFLDAIEAAGSELLDATDRTITLGPVRLHVLPPAGVPAWDQNDNSVGVVVEFGAFRATLAGDAEARAWLRWMEGGHVPAGPVQVHKASHHGSTNGDQRDALRRLRPELVVVGAARGNTYGHPHQEALALYRAVGADVLLTMDEGTVSVTAVSDGSWTVRTARPVGRPGAAPARR